MEYQSVKARTWLIQKQGPLSLAFPASHLRINSKMALLNLDLWPKRSPAQEWDSIICSKARYRIQIEPNTQETDNSFLEDVELLSKDWKDDQLIVNLQFRSHFSMQKLEQLQQKE